MNTPLITRAPDYADMAFQKGPVLFQHTLHTMAMFSDAGLAGLLEDHPEHLTDLNIYTFLPGGQAGRINNGSRAGLSGHDVLKAVSRGELWINLRHINEANAEACALMDDLRHALEAIHPRFKGARLDGNLLISAPNAKVPFHADQPDVLLCHIRGAKRIWVYPNDGEHLPDAHFEKVVMRETTEDLPFDRSFDADAAVFDLQPGQALTWPTNAPHRVENLGTVNVSLSIEYMTWGARMRLGAYYVNGAQRRMGLSPRPVASFGPVGLAARWGLSVPLKKLGLHKARERMFTTDFTLKAETKEDNRQEA